jgi:hypothetical protein
MKKVKIVLRPGSPGKKFYLFPTAKSLYAWMRALERNERIQVPNVEEIVLEPGGFIEAELRGFEYSYEGGQKFRRFDLIRLGKAQQSKNSSGLIVTIHSGWVSGGLLPLKPYVDADIEVKLLDQHNARLDLSAFFDDEQAEFDEIDVDEEDNDK